MRKKYLFFDIDGTLIAGGYGNGYIPESTLSALKILREKGHFLAIATGRSQAMAYDIMQYLGFENMVSDGGYGITVGGKLLEIKLLPKENFLALEEECNAKGFPWALSTENSRTRYAPDSRFQDETQDNYMETVVVPGLNVKDQESVYKMYVACRYPEEFSLETLKNLPWCRYHDSYFFAEPTCKAEGIIRMMRLLHADCRDVIVFGDAANDLSMFRDEWTNVAMGNAIQELKDRADIVTTDVDKDGIYHACLRLKLI